jgi:hypothetical protein
MQNDDINESGQGALIEYDGGFHADVVRYQIKGNPTSDTLHWRLIARNGSVIVVRPLQLKKGANPLCLPLCIKPALSPVSELIRWVQGYIITKDSPEEHSEHKSKSRKQYYQEVSLYEINRFIHRHTGKALVRIKKCPAIGYTRPDRDGIIQRLTKNKQLEEIRQFILNESLVAGDKSNVVIQAKSCQKLTNFIGEKVGVDLRLSIMKSFNPKIATNIQVWINEIKKTWKLTEKQAENSITDRVHYIATCEGLCGNELHPVENIAYDVEREDEAVTSNNLTINNDEVTAPITNLTVSGDLGSVPAKTTPANNPLELEYRLEDAETHYRIVWEGEEITAGKPNTGLDYLRILLGDKKNKVWDPTVLYTTVRGKSVPDPKTSKEDLVNENLQEMEESGERLNSIQQNAKKNLKNYEAEKKLIIAKLKEIRVDVAESGDRNFTEEDSKQIENYNEELNMINSEIQKEKRILRGRLPRDTSDRDKHREATRTAIKRCLRDITSQQKPKKKKAAQSFADHIKQYLMKGYTKEICYEPDPTFKINWRI